MAPKRELEEVSTNMITALEASLASLKWTMTISIGTIERDLQKLKSVLEHSEEIESCKPVERPKKAVRTNSSDAPKLPMRTIEELTQRERDGLKASKDNGQYYHEKWLKAKNRREQDIAMKDVMSYLPIAEEKQKEKLLAETANADQTDDKYVHLKPIKKTKFIDGRTYIGLDSVEECAKLIEKEIGMETADEIRYRVANYMSSLITAISYKKDPNYDYTKTSTLVLSEKAILKGFSILLSTAGGRAENTYALIGPLLEKCEGEVVPSIRAYLAEFVMDFLEGKDLFDDEDQEEHMYTYKVEPLEKGVYRITTTYKVVYAADADAETEDE